MINGLIHRLKKVEIGNCTIEWAERKATDYMSEHKEICEIVNCEHELMDSTFSPVLYCSVNLLYSTGKYSIVSKYSKYSKLSTSRSRKSRIY